MPKITYYNGDYKPLSQKLRREMTRQEKHLWYDFLKSYPIPFHRQRQFGHYIVDFYCATAKLVVELDGSQHYEPEVEQRDAERDQHLSALGLTVLRFGNYDVDRHFDSVCATPTAFPRWGRCPRRGRMRSSPTSRFAPLPH